MKIRIKCALQTVYDSAKPENETTHSYTQVSIKQLSFSHAFRVTQYRVSEFLIFHLHIPQLMIDVQIHNFNKEMWNYLIYLSL